MDQLVEIAIFNGTVATTNGVYKISDIDTNINPTSITQLICKYKYTSQRNKIKSRGIIPFQF